MSKVSGYLASPYLDNCATITWNLTAIGTNSQQLVLPALSDTWWACIKSIRQCLLVSHNVHGTHPLFCVLTHILPQLYNYYEDTGHLHLAMMPDHSWPKWVIPILIPFLVSSGTGGSATLGYISGMKNTCAHPSGDACLQKLDLEPIPWQSVETLAHQRGNPETLLQVLSQHLKSPQYLREAEGTSNLPCETRGLQLSTRCLNNHKGWHGSSQNHHCRYTCQHTMSGLTQKDTQDSGYHFKLPVSWGTIVTPRNGLPISAVFTVHQGGDGCLVTVPLITERHILEYWN